MISHPKPKRKQTFLLLSWAGGQSFSNPLIERRQLFQGPAFIWGTHVSLPQSVRPRIASPAADVEIPFQGPADLLQHQLCAYPLLLNVLFLILTLEGFPLFLLCIFFRAWLCFKIAFTIFYQACFSREGSLEAKFSILLDPESFLIISPSPL